MPEKLCCRCRRTWPLAAFARRATTSDGLEPACKACERERILVWKHGMTSLEKEEVLAAQDGCAICGRTTPSLKGWSVDHDRGCCSGDRSCAQCRRGILCQWCNTALGYAGDDPARLRRMADYLELGTRLLFGSDTDSDSDIRYASPVRSPTNRDEQ